MKFIVNRDLFSRALSRIQGVLNRKATLPILSNVLIETRGRESLRFAATDLDVTFDGEVSARVVEEGRVTVDGRRLYEISRSLPGEEVEVEVDGRYRAYLRCKASEFMLNGLAADDFPSLPSAEGVELHPVDGLGLRELFERTSISISNDDSRPALTGVYFDCVGNGRIRMVSTDGHRLSLGERDVRRDGDIPEREGVILPRKGVGEIKRLLDELGEEVSFGFLENNFVLAGSDVRLFVRLIDAAFPDYGQVIPKTAERRLVLKREAFLASLRRIAILASERTHGVRVELEAGRIVLVSDNPDLGKGREELDIASYEGADMTIAFNAKYVAEILSSLGADKIEIALNEALSPGIFREHNSDEYLFVVMPMRL